MWLKGRDHGYAHARRLSLQNIKICWVNTKFEIAITGIIIENPSFYSDIHGFGWPSCIHTENQNQVSFYPFVLHEISVLIELTLGHLRYHLTDVPPREKLVTITAGYISALAIIK